VFKNDGIVKLLLSEEKKVEKILIKHKLAFHK